MQTELSRATDHGTTGDEKEDKLRASENNNKKVWPRRCVFHLPSLATGSVIAQASTDEKPPGQKGSDASFAV